MKMPNWAMEHHRCFINSSSPIRQLWRSIYAVHIRTSILFNRWPFFYSPIGADQWADPDSRYLKDSDYWNLCSGRPQTGDVIAEHGHVGIVTGYRRTTSASARTDPMGIVVENDWGFRSGNNPTCWRYNYSKLPRTPMSI